MLEIVPSDAVIGATLPGVKLGGHLSSSLLDAIEEALERYGVLVFPDQKITPTEQIAFSRRLGTLETLDYEDGGLAGYPEICQVGNADGRRISFSPNTPDGELEWHSDHIHLPTPARASLLYATKVPSHGGETYFACMYHAYDALSSQQKETYEALTLIHSVTGLRDYLQEHGEYAQESLGVSPGSVYGRFPLVRHHPLTGRAALYFASHATIGVEGWPQGEAMALVRTLTAHSTRRAFQYRHGWRENDAVLWDNRRVLHAGAYYDIDRESRHMFRTTIREDHRVI